MLGRLLGGAAPGPAALRALEQAPAAFPPLYVATVRAAEKTSDLVPALTRYVAYQAQLEAIRKRVVNASIYPLLLIAVGGAGELFLMLYVVPRFGKIYAERSGDLPFFSQVLIAWGELVAGPRRVIASSRLASPWWASVFMLCQTRVPRRHSATRLWRVPAIGERLKVYQLARFYRTTGMLLRGGMPLVRGARHGGRAAAPGAARAARRGEPRDQRGPRRVAVARRQRPHHAGRAAHAARWASAAATWAR